jgi:hypothetical protein
VLGGEPARREPQGRQQHQEPEQSGSRADDPRLIEKDDRHHGEVIWRPRSVAFGMSLAKRLCAKSDDRTLPDLAKSDIDTFHAKRDVVWI